MNKDSNVSIIDKDLYENKESVVENIQMIKDSKIVDSLNADGNIK